MKKLIKFLYEPLVHFLAIGGILFIVFDLSTSRKSNIENQLEVNLAIQNNLKQQFQNTWKRPPTRAEENKLIEHYIREEVYYREAIALSLDKSDTVIRQRLRQKLEFMSQIERGLLEASTEQLQQYFKTNSDNYLVHEKREFSHFILGESHNEQYEDEILTKLKNIFSADKAKTFSDKSIMPQTLPLSNKQEIALTFGNDFAEKVMQLSPAQWHGPINTHLGNHFVYITNIQESYLPELSKVIKRVKNDWRYKQEFKNKEQQFQRYLTNYNIVITNNDEQ